MEHNYEFKLSNPKIEASFLSKLFFTWLCPLFYLGTKKHLDLADLHCADAENQSKLLADQLEQSWRQEINPKSKKPNLLRAILKTFGKEYFIIGVAVFIEFCVVRAPQGLILAWLIELFTTTTTTDLKKKHQISIMYCAASLLILSSFLMTLLTHQTNYSSNIVGMRVRVALSSLVQRKIMRLSQQALNVTAPGQIVTLLANDCQRFDLVATFLHQLWIMPFLTVIVTYFLWRLLGVASLAGLFTMIVGTLPVLAYLSHWVAQYRRQVALCTDERVKLTSQLINGIEVIKMYVWERPFELLVSKLRMRELKYVARTKYTNGLYLSNNVLIERATLCVTLIVYTLLGNRIDAQRVFAAAQFFNLLQYVLVIKFPGAVGFGAEALVAVKRIEEFLLLEERDVQECQKQPTNGIKLENVNASWNGLNPTLTGITLTVPDGALCAIIGPVGAGKSSLLNLLLGELPASSVDGVNNKLCYLNNKNMSYAAQEPWLFTGSVRRNIIFGAAYDQTRYNRVIRACALGPDFQQLPFGDLTAVGDRGLALSGGQKARINLARAIYRQSDIYLLDDPLSAVDTHVAQHLFDRCIVKFLSNRTRILVTHQLQYLKQADLILVLTDGRIDICGTFDELSKNRQFDFTKMLHANAQDYNNTELDNSAMETVTCHKTDSTSLVNNNMTDEENNEEFITVKSTRPLWQYVKSVKSPCLIVMLCLILLLAQVACTLCDLWVTFWTSQEAQMSIHHNDSSISVTALSTNSAIYVYSGLIVLVVTLVLIRAFFFFKLTNIAGINLHARMLHNLVHAQMRFFHTNSSGRILNRFSKDLGAIDEILPRILLETIQIMLVMFGILVTIVLVNYYLLVAMFFLGGAFLMMRSWLICSSRALKLLEGKAKSPIFSHTNASLRGLTTIRALSAQQQLIDEFDLHQDVHTATFQLIIGCSEFFGLWLDIICVMFTACVAFGFILAAQFGYPPNASLVGLALAQALILTGMLQYGMSRTADVVNHLTSVERAWEYTKLNLESDDDRCQKTASSFPALPVLPWPSFGKIEFKMLNLYYDRSEPAVLKNLTFLIRSKEKIGIVGRTGAGKSSLITSLFRLADYDGQILIDDLDTKTVNLTDLRKRISIIPQEPVLFSATLRYNLDPFDEYTDQDLWEALEEVELKQSVVGDSLNQPITEGGSNFSLGQRQLICLARALLRKNRILILDEATANVDVLTDKLIQSTIRRKFVHCTVLTIAHRLDTIIDNDRVLVLDNGRIREFAHPFELLTKDEGKCGYFQEMVKKTGLKMSEQLRGAAHRSWLLKCRRESVHQDDYDDNNKGVMISTKL